MKNLIIAALACTFSLSSFPSEKGGNRLNRSYELQLSLEMFEENKQCSIYPDSEFSSKQVCQELKIEFLSEPRDTIAEEFYNQCCEK